MPPGPGRPPKEEEDRVRTKLTRVDEELGEKLAEVVEALGTNSARYLDPLIRTQIENDHAANLPAIKEIRKAQAALEKAREAMRKARGASPVLANDLGGEQ